MYFLSSIENERGDRNAVRKRKFKEHGRLKLMWLELALQQ